ncbi:DUF5677 domain-containing protein [Candidatus Pantoea formicae]|uniref:Uncharacterized protein n=1 Tax=Candidatus Pantoea formicae TaxID=2608355 RepID=A0ABX0R078_9GAMM|nr:DUF5677 domain-containing protein [Pantoea formicae]NIF01544.1 hypothetical protein [Pantoea formicae]
MLNEFRSEKGLSDKLDLSDIKESLLACKEANDKAYAFISNLECDTEEKSFSNFVSINMIGRVYEQIEGMLLCIATKSYTSAEAIARVVFESSINLMYMALCGDEKTIAAFMSKWVVEHRRKLDEWKKDIVGKRYQAQVEALINERVNALRLYEEYVEKVREKFDVTPEQYNTLWTNSLFKRFEALNKEADYYSIYHRLSGSSHMTAEDTIMFMISIQLPDEIRYKVAVEACSYSIMMTRIVSFQFIESVAASCIRHGMADISEIEGFKQLQKNVYNSIEEIKVAAGVPDLNG